MTTDTNQPAPLLSRVQSTTATTVAARTLKRATWPSAGTSSANPDDFQSILEAVTGVHADLRGAASPQGGWLTLAQPGSGHWWSAAAYNTPLVSVDPNTAAFNYWSAQVGELDKIAQQLAAGKIGLIDVQKLQDAETLTGDLAKTYGDAVNDFKSLAGPLEGNQTALAGNAAGVILDNLHSHTDDVNTQYGNLTDKPSPAVADVLKDAAAALASFGQQMAGAYLDAGKTLQTAPADTAGAAVTNISAYLQAGLNSIGQNTPAAQGLGQAKQVLAGYNSGAAGNLPAGMAPISGDLSQQPVWDSVNTAITGQIGAELEKMDAVARKALAELSTAYATATNRLRVPQARQFVKAAPPPGS